MIVKHANPCGVAIAATIEEAYERALASDPLSAYGGVVAVNRPVSHRARRAAREAVRRGPLAPAYDEEAAGSLREKPATRILLDTERRDVDRGEKDIKRVIGGVLIQDRDWDVENRDGMRVVCGDREREPLGRPALRLARLQARHLERDRDRQGPADPRDRGRAAEPRPRGRASRSRRPASTATT